MAGSLRLSLANVALKTTYIISLFSALGQDEFQEGLETLYDNDWLFVTDLHDRDAC